MNRFQGFPDPDGVFLLDTWTGELVLYARTGERRVLNAGRPELATAAAQGIPTVPSIVGMPQHVRSAMPARAPLTEVDDTLHLELPTGSDDLDREVADRKSTRLNSSH